MNQNVPREEGGVEIGRPSDDNAQHPNDGVGPVSIRLATRVLQRVPNLDFE